MRNFSETAPATSCTSGLLQHLLTIKKCLGLKHIIYYLNALHRIDIPRALMQRFELLTGFKMHVFLKM